MALPRERRVRRTGEFRRVREQGRSWTGRLLILAVLPVTEGESISRAGFTLTRRYGNAVTRNRTRRRLQAIIQPLLADITPPRLIVTIPRGPAAKADIAELRVEWVRLARRAGLLTANTVEE